MELTRRDVIRRNLFRAGAALGSAVAISVSAGAHADNQNMNGNNEGLQNGVGPDGPPGLEGRQGGGASTCFGRGTLILTADGEKQIEELQEGDMLPALFAKVAPVVRITRWHNDVAPIRIKGGTLDGQRGDLVLTEHHAVLIGDVLVAAGNLVNGKTIVREPWQAGEFFNIQLGGHDVVIAHGVACES